MKARALLALTVLSACTTSDVVAVGVCTQASHCRSGMCIDGGCVPYDASTPIDAQPDASHGFCDGTGPLVFVGDSQGTELCAGDVAQTTFRFAICTCESLALSNSLMTDAFDSRVGPYTTPMGGASVGVVGSITTNGVLQVGGALTVSGAGIMLAPSGGLLVRGDLSSGGAVTGNSSISVLSEARINGNVSASSLAVGSTLTVPSGRTISVSPGPNSVGSLVRAPVNVAPPCDCAAQPRIDIGAIVAEQVSGNDNALIGLATSGLMGLSTNTTRTLPCGRYYVSGIQTTGGAHLTIDVTGRVALFVDGDVMVSGNLSITLAAGAELDLFIARDINVLGTFMVGDPTHAARSRVYVGGDQSIALSSTAAISANLYAPTSALQVSGALEVYGSLFAENIAASDRVTVHYDRAVLGSGVDCNPQPTCESCLDCGNQACKSGSCSPCTTTADCCAPLECFDGQCTVEIL